MDKENVNYQNFLQDMRKTFGTINIAAPSLIKLTKDNSFIEFCIDFCNQLSQNIDEAILEKEYTSFQNMLENQHRYLATIFDALSFSIPDENSVKAIKGINFLLDGWLRMAGENKSILKELPDNYIEDIKKDIEAIDDIVNLSTTVKFQIEMANKLIQKAHSVLAAAPRAFNMSESFANALKESMKE